MATSAYTELGSTGLNRWGGYVREEFLRELQGQQGMKVYREMMDNDDIIGALLYAMEYLSRQVEWSVKPNGEGGAQAEAVAEWFSGALFDDMSHSWQDVLSEILTMLPFGFALLEVVYKKRAGETPDAKTRSNFVDGKIGWRKWSIRAQETITRWDFDESGGIKGAVQSAPPEIAEVYLPIEKCLLFRTSTRRNNPEGRSILRNAYRAWYYKKRIQEIEGIGIERDLAGLPMLRPPEGVDLWNPNDPGMVSLKAEAEHLVRSIRRDENEGVLIPFGWEFELLSTGSRRQFDTTTIIGRYDERIAMSVMADFILIGHDAVGSKALAASKVRVFGLAMNAFLDQIADVINRFAIPRLAQLNGWPEEVWPELEHGDVEPVDLGQLGDFISKLSAAGMPLFPNPTLERYVLTTANIPVPDPGDEGSPEAMAEQREEEKEAMREQMGQEPGTPVPEPGSPAATRQQTKAPKEVPEGEATGEEEIENARTRPREEAQKRGLDTIIDRIEKMLDEFDAEAGREASDADPFDPDEEEGEADADGEEAHAEDWAEDWSEMTPPDDIVKHLPGKHEQKTHGGKSGGGDVAYDRPPVRKVKNVGEAVDRILKGEVVELTSVRKVNTVLKRLASMAADAKRLGKEAPNYDLCKVSVAGTNLFCASKVKTAENPEGIPRVKMPQMGGKPRPGSDADKLPKNDEGEIDGSEAFMGYLKARGIKADMTDLPAAQLKASQAELVGPKVAGMMTAATYDPGKKPIFVSRDDYVVDGHHRWAAVVGRDAEDGKLGDARMHTVKIDAPITEILKLANSWADEFGILPKAAKTVGKHLGSKHNQKTHGRGGEEEEGWGDPRKWTKGPPSAPPRVKPVAPVGVVQEKAEHMMRQQGAQKVKWTRKLTHGKFPTGVMGWSGEAQVSAKGYKDTRMLVSADSDGSEMMIRPAPSLG